MRTIILLFALLTASDAYALRCGHRLVQLGNYTTDVLEICGEPDTVNTHTAVRGTRLGIGSPLEIDQFEEVEIEEWIYNFGPRKLKEYLEFENGVLKKLHTLSHGY